MTTTTTMRVRARQMRHSRVRSKIVGTAERPRVSVFRSNAQIYLQLIDDTKGTTLMSQTDRGMKAKNKTERAKLAGEQFAQAATKKGIKQMVFDRGGYKYQGRVAAVADGIRKGGVKI